VRNALQTFVALQVTVIIVVRLEEIDVDHHERKRLARCRRARPFARDDRVEHATVAHARQAVGERQAFQFALELREPFLGALALADVEHEADQRVNVAVLFAHNVDNVADPHVAAVGGQCAIVRFVVGARLRLRDAKIHHGLAVVRMHARGPVLDRFPGGGRIAEQRFDLRADIGELHRRPVDLPGNCPGGFEQRAVNGGVVLAGLAPGRCKARLVAQECGLKGTAGRIFVFVAHRDRPITRKCIIGR
jgi:hypothetical protein